MRLLAGLLLAIATAASAQDAPPIAKFVPPTPDPAHVFVLDSAHILSPRAIAALQDSARALQTETAADVAWVTLPTLGGRPIEEAALYIGRTWRIGSPGKPGDPLRNRGLVILYIPDKTQTAGPNFRIEVGNGLEGTITDSRSRAITTAMRDDLRAKRYDEAYLAGWTVVARFVRADFVTAGEGLEALTSRQVGRPPTRARRVVAFVGVVIIATLVIGLIMLMIASSRNRPAGPGASREGGRRRRRRNATRDLSSIAIATSSSDSGGSSSSDSGGSSGGDYGGGGGFSGGGSSDTI